MRIMCRGRRMNNEHSRIWEKRQFAEPNKSCWGCKHSFKSPGSSGSFYEPSEPPVPDCDYYDETMTEEQQEKFIEIYGKNYEKWEEDATDCPYFEPEVVGICDHCKEATDLIVLEAPTLCIFEREYYCSEECKGRALEMFNEIEKELPKM